VGLTDLVRRRRPPVAIVPTVVERDAAALSFDAWIGMLQSFTYQSLTYSLPSARQDEIAPGFASVARTAYKSAGVVFACCAARQLLFSEARFQFRARSSTGRPGKLFGTQALRPLEQPWPTGTTGDLLTRMIQHADLGGNAYVARVAPGQLDVLRPDWVTIVGGTLGDGKAGVWDPGATVLGYVYQPGGPNSGADPVTFLADDVAHFAPYPDPDARFRGMSWITPVVREVMADKAATDHKLAFFENGATPNLVVKTNVDDVKELGDWIELFKGDHEGATNAYRTLFLGAGADVTPVGADFRQLDFKQTQGAGETRIAAAAGVPPVIVGLSEGLQAATYSNYSQARRRFADGTMRPMWRACAAALARLVDVPAGSDLWYDDRDIPFLQEDLQDRATIMQTQAGAMLSLVNAGFEPGSVVAAVEADDLGLLVHTGLLSVQLQEPGATAPAGDPTGGVPSAA